MVIACIWLFEGATVNIGYCSSYCKIFETGLFALCSYECLSKKGATNRSKFLVNLVLVCLNVLAFQFPGAKEQRSQGVTLCGCEYNISFRLTGLPEVWPLYECIQCISFLAFSTHLLSLQEPLQEPV